MILYAVALPLYEAKMIHQFDHRWASYRTQGGKTVSVDVPLPDKQDPAFVVLPRYWVDVREVHERIRMTSAPDSGRNPHPRRTADLPGPPGAPSSLQPSQTLRDGGAGGNTNFPGVRHVGPQPAERAPLLMRAGDPRFQRAESARAGGARIRRTGGPHVQDAGGSRTQDTGSRPSADASFGDPSRNFIRQLPADAIASDARSFTRTEASDLAEDTPDQANQRWLMGWRDITRSVEKRTTIADIIPFGAVGNQFLLMYPDATPRLAAVLLGLLNSFVFDFVARQKLSGIHLQYFTMKQTAVLPPDAFSNVELAFVVPRVLELLYTGEDLRHFARDCGWDGPPFRWDEERRFLLRCELDAAFFHLYLPADANGDWCPARRSDGCPCDETADQLADLKRHFPTARDAITGILDTFPGVRREDEAKHGEYRTKRIILETYDEIQQAVRTRRPYQSRLNPPPSDRSCCHPPRTIVPVFPVSADLTELPNGAWS